MTCLADLPPEILLPILGHLSLVDVRTFLTSQATCSIFRSLARDILARPPTILPPGRRDIGRDCHEDISCPVPHPFLVARFGMLFQSASCFTDEERSATRWFLSLNGDVTRPIRRLPWARDAHTRDRYLRAGASWRHLSVNFGLGLPITRVEIIKSYSSEDLDDDGRDHVQYLQVDDLPVPGGGSGVSGFLTMGLLYDLLLCGGVVGDSSAATLGRETGGWELVLGARLRSYELLVEYECFILDDEELVDTGPGAAQSAILYVRGGTVDGEDQDRRFHEPDDDEPDWLPEPLGVMPNIRLASS